MSRFASCLTLVFSLSAGSALAGPNSGGTIIAVDANYTYTGDNTTSYCGLGTAPTSCVNADVRLDGTYNGGHPIPSIWKIYAAFPQGSSPRLKGLAFGIHYPDLNEPRIFRWGGCPYLNYGPLENDGPGWPLTDTGTSLVFPTTQTTLLTECFWFAGYSYSGVPFLFQLRGNPELGGLFADDEQPTVLDPIAGYGALGFDMDGVAVCPPPIGACCSASDGNCSMTIQVNCPSPNAWMGPGTNCSPSPCSGGGDSTSCVTKTLASLAPFRSRAAPNPSTGFVAVYYRLSVVSAVTVEIFNPSGAVVRRLAQGTLAAGPHVANWDGRNHAGERLPPGTYFTRIETPAGVIIGKVVLAH